MYEYAGLVTRVVDGDTVHATVDLGCDVHINLTLRLAGIDAPEMSTAAGLLAREWLFDTLRSSANAVTIRTVKDRREKYGRYLATLYTPGGISINELMVQAGFAVPYDGGPR